MRLVHIYTEVYGFGIPEMGNNLGVKGFLRLMRITIDILELNLIVLKQIIGIRL